MGATGLETTPPRRSRKFPPLRTSATPPTPPALLGRLRIPSTPFRCSRSLSQHINKAPWAAHVPRLLGPALIRCGGGLSSSDDDSDDDVDADKVGSKAGDGNDSDGDEGGDEAIAYADGEAMGIPDASEPPMATSVVSEE